jgi:CBS-domain-containing membrane protein
LRPIPSATLKAHGRSRLLDVALIGAGVFLALSALGALSASTGLVWMLGSFGASSVLLFGFPDAPFSRPRNVVGAHLLTSAVGLLFLQLLGPGWPAMAAAGACAAMLMVVTGIVHPPAGGNPVIVFLLQPGWDFLLMPTLAGATALVAVAALYWRGVGQARLED